MGDINKTRTNITSLVFTEIYIVDTREEGGGRRWDSIKFFISPPAPVLVSRQCQIVCLPPQTSVYKIPKIPSFFILTLFEIYSSVYISPPPSLLSPARHLTRQTVVLWRIIKTGDWKYKSVTAGWDWEAAGERIERSDWDSLYWINNYRVKAWRDWSTD